MSRHWKPEREAAPISTARKRWPEGAVAGLLLVAVACVGAVAVLYQVAGPRDVFEGPSD
jgi:hypothetical protein